MKASGNFSSCKHIDWHHFPLDSVVPEVWFSCTIIITEGIQLLLDQVASLVTMMTDILIMSIIGSETETVTDNEMKKTQVVHQIHFTTAWIKHPAVRLGEK